MSKDQKSAKKNVKATSDDVRPVLKAKTNLKAGAKEKFNHAQP